MKPRSAIYWLLAVVQVLILVLAGPLGCASSPAPLAPPPTETAPASKGTGAAEGGTTAPSASPDQKAYPRSPKEAEALKKSGTSWSNAEIRAHYNRWVTTIAALNEEWKREGVPAEERARRAFDVCHTARITCRAMMADPLEVKDLERRDQEKHGNPDGPTFERLVESQREKGVTGDAAYEAIIESSQRTYKETIKLIAREAR